MGMPGKSQMEGSEIKVRGSRSFCDDQANREAGSSCPKTSSDRSLSVFRRLHCDAILDARETQRGTQDVRHRALHQQLGRVS